ncbi:hypothetical protein [Sphingomonas sp. CV7422]|uniref:hypothetical protein n=1 Tax=Sphingomonas sp. CV7422 TaxID=3018036 RepID=UPI0022FE6BA1|nr:hypothetical protein [Sphingomonas sp. CV7422]
MQFRLLTAIVVFLGSYLPLSVILFSQNIDYKAWHRDFCFPLAAGSCQLPLHEAGYSVTLLGITLACFGLTILSLALIRPKQGVIVKEAEYVPTDLMNYTLPYVVSFMGINYNETSKFVGFCVFLVWMFWITHRSGQVLLNPVLIALGWRLYNVTYEYPGSADNFKGRALVKGYLEPGRYNQCPVQDIQIIKP